MKKIIDEIIAVLSSTQSASVHTKEEMINTLVSHLDGHSIYRWDKKFPIAVVHSQERIKEKEIRDSFLEEGILTTDGFTLPKMSRSVCNKIAMLSPQYIQEVDIMVFCTQVKSDMVEFAPKRPHDFWKKLTGSVGMEAMVEMEYFDVLNSAKIEFELREVIRKRKENSALKDVGFIWIAAVDESEIAQGVFEHYFHQNNCQVHTSDERNCSYWIGWSDTLREISMRTFYAY